MLLVIKEQKVTHPAKNVFIDVFINASITATTPSVLCYQSWFVLLCITVLQSFQFICIDKYLVSCSSHASVWLATESFN